MVPRRRGCGCCGVRVLPGVLGVPPLRCVSRCHPCPPGGADGAQMGCNLLTQAQCMLMLFKNALPFSSAVIIILQWSTEGEK